MTLPEIPEGDIAQAESLLELNAGNKSQTIRDLNGLDPKYWTRGHISRVMTEATGSTISYQRVNNTLNPKYRSKRVKEREAQDTATATEASSIKAQIVDLTEDDPEKRAVETDDLLTQ